MLDTRGWGALFGGGGDSADAACELMTTFGGLCEPCPSDGEPYCTELQIDQIPAERVDESIIPVEDEACE